MMVPAEAIASHVLREQLKFLANKPRHLEFALGVFGCGGLFKEYGANYISQCVDFIRNNRINVAPYYEADLQSLPRVSIVASYTESQQYLGDYGSETVEKIIPPVIIANFDVIENNGSSLKVSYGSGLHKKVWTGLTVTNGSASAKIVSVHGTPESGLTVNLDSEIPAGTALKGWRAQTGTGSMGFVLGMSTDDVTVQFNLRTSGEASVHRLLALIIRYCLKRSRLPFEMNGLQVSTFLQTPMIVADDADMEYETVFTMQCKATDTWIVSEFETPVGYDVDVMADANEQPGRVDVEFDG